MVSSSGLDDWGSIPNRGNERTYSLCHYIQSDSGAHPASYLMGTRDSLPGGTAGDKADHSPPSSAKV
jgi:hypothetical protein